MGDGTFTGRVDYVHRGDFQYRVFNHPDVDTVPSYNLVNVFLNYTPHDSMYSFSLAATNLFDKDGVNSRFTNPYGAFITSEEYIPPRQVVATLKLRF